MHLKIDSNLKIQSMKYSLLKIQTPSHHCSAENPPMASIKLGTESLTWPPTPTTWTLPTSPTSSTPSPQSLFSTNVSFLSLPQNKSTSLQPLGLYICSSRSSEDWLSSLGSQFKCHLFWDAFCLVYVTVFHCHALFFIITSLFENSIFIYHLFSTPTTTI